MRNIIKLQSLIKNIIIKILRRICLRINGYIDKKLNNFENLDFVFSQ